MKTRHGFVSNSSSASFVIIWRCDTEQGSDGEALPLSEALDILWEYGDPKLKNKLIEKTVVETNGSFRTTSHTSMFNDYSDFSSEIKELLFALEARKVDEYNTRAVFDIINKYIDKD